MKTLFYCFLGSVLFAASSFAGSSESYKWNQPPVPASPTNIFYGWNQPSVHTVPNLQAADDWICTTTNPVTKVRWWGSFTGWTEPTPPFRPWGFWIEFWPDVPAGSGLPFSHPGSAPTYARYYTNFTCKFVGLDFDPRTQTYESCFLFEQDLGAYPFYQQTNATGSNTYWLCLEANQPLTAQYWGWKTRPRDSHSGAPDAAVVFNSQGPPFNWQPILWPYETNAWDLAFELVYEKQGSLNKWAQVPDLSTNGIDVNATFDPLTPPPYLLADDFLCTATGPITNISIWGSWWNDQYPQGSAGNVAFTISIHSDVPKAGSPTGYSVPGPTLWLTNLAPGQFQFSQIDLTQIYEGWWNPAEPTYQPIGDHNCYRFDFPIPITNAFVQQGTPDNPIVYWLDIQAQPVGAAPGTVRFGWKTCITNWNDDATWVSAIEPAVGQNWNEMRYPSPHPKAGQSVDLAFRIQGSGAVSSSLKWSQPPVPYASFGFNGWNEYSVFASTQIVADDWVCTNPAPVTDIHWWASFLGWSESLLPQLPDAFNVSFWKDVPASPTQPFSHPGLCLQTLVCTNLNPTFVGWDYDPRDPNGVPDACFRFDQTLLPSQFFVQERGTNIYWISIAAIYYNQIPSYPFGWKTRPRDPASLAPDAAVRISSPTAPLPGIQYASGSSIFWPYSTNGWDMAFALTTQEELVATNDFGDAPSPYPTLLANDGARHLVVPGVFMGTNVDAELDGQPDLNAKGDDNNPPAGPNDEDGVTWTSFLIPGELASVQVVASTGGYLSAWIDFNADGIWSTAGDQIFTNVLLSAGVNSLSFKVPFASARGTNTFARFRFCTQTITNFTGWCPDGEVEDYQVRIEELDFGDAPDGPYPTLFANNGARHVVWRNIFLGAAIDSEFDGQPNPTATGDDINPPAGPNDEDGVVLTSPLVTGQPAKVQVTASIAGALLNAWIDFGADGTWATPGDQIFTNIVLNAGINVLNFFVPPNANSKLYARFRYSTMPNLSFVGLAPNGEVEDYLWPLSPLDYGDAPDPAYPTLYAHNGARHPVGNLFLGARIDAEPDGQPDPNAKGDDNNPPAGLSDEDGIVFNTALISGVPASIKVTASGAGLLQGWIDFNRNGSWAEANEQILVNYPVVAGANNISFSVPNGMANGKTFARFRLSTVTNLTYYGYAPDGEVEDYAVTLYPLKWLQPPEQGSEGVDVDDSVLLADDFYCTNSGPITDIHVWGSFLHDVLPVGGPGNMTITLSIYDDVPAGPLPYSHPGNQLWTMTFGPGQYQAGWNMRTSEWWLTPPANWMWPGDTNMYQFDFYIDPEKAYSQVQGHVYWLAMSYTAGATQSSFGWKTTPNGFNDDACWFDLAGGIWRELRYTAPHPRAGTSLDLAFALSGGTQAYDLDFGDAPRPYPTPLASDGARHYAVPGFRLGLLEDTEADGQPDPQAQGDDVNNLADEDGVAFASPLIVNATNSVSVTLTAPAGYTGRLDAWIDFNGNSIWEPGEQIFSNLVLLPGANPGLSFVVPRTAKLGTNYARFRLSSAGGLGPTGLAQDGEVEDYMTRIVQSAPGTNIVITNLVVTNLFLTNKVIGLAWTYETNVHYRVKYADSLGTAGTNAVWFDAGQEIIGPDHWYWGTNSPTTVTQRFYRIYAPFIWP